jgi:hypothetical protein
MTGTELRARFAIALHGRATHLPLYSSLSGSWTAAAAAVAAALLLALAVLDRPTGVIVVGALVFGAALTRVAPADRGFLQLLYLVAFLSRLAAAVVAYHGAAWLGASPFILPDAWAYDWVASTMARAWSGEPIWVDPGERYLISRYTSLVGGIYWLLGHSPVAVLALNAATAAATATLIAMTTGRLFDRPTARLAGLAAAFFPSVFFWSILLLKDSLYLFLVAVVLWAFVEIVIGRRFLCLVPLLLAWGMLAEVRNFAFYLLGLLLPLAFFLGSSLPLARRLTVGTLFTVVVVGGLWTGGVEDLVSRYFARDAAAVLEYHREANAMNANTGFLPTRTPGPTDTPRPTDQPVASLATLAVTPAAAGRAPAVVATAIPPAVDGPPFVTSTGSIAAAATVARTTEAPPLTTDPTAGADTAGAADAGQAASRSPGGDAGAPSPPASAADSSSSRPADTPAVQPSATTIPVPAEVAAPAALATQPAASGGYLVDMSDSIQAPPSSLGRTLEYVPKGLLYMIAAPFPWDTAKPTQRVTIPDMLLWYAALLLAAVALVVYRRRWRLLVLPVGYLVGIGLLLALVEGNVGSLFRHRAMLIPFTTMFSAAGAVWLWRRYGRRPTPGAPSGVAGARR